MWKGSSGLQLLLPLFHTQHKDAELFGSRQVDVVGEEEEEDLPTYTYDRQQLRNMVLQATLDVIMTIDAFHQ
eukprot:17137-Eustigmatos_ZCMA.PRE.1